MGIKSGLMDFVDGSFDRAVAITLEMFGYDCSTVLRQMLANPMLRSGESSGDLAVENGDVVGFQAAMPRRMYYGREEFRATVGSTLAMRHDASPVLLWMLMKATVMPRGGSLMFIANTANPTSMKMNRLLGVKGAGPSSCERIRFAVLRPGSFARFASRCRVSRFAASVIDGLFTLFSRRKMPIGTSVVDRINVVEMDEFWRRYLQRNRGLVSSRAGAEVAWAFGKGIDTGRNVMIVLRDGAGVKGYVVARAADNEGLRWRIADWIAVGDDLDVLGTLLKAVVIHLRDSPSAGVLESIGFNDSVKDLLAIHLPWVRQTPNNTFLWQITDEKFREACHPDFGSDWFWGPYDGDRFMS